MVNTKAISIVNVGLFAAPAHKFIPLNLLHILQQLTIQISSEAVLTVYPDIVELCRPANCAFLLFSHAGYNALTVVCVFALEHD
jgi:hypothetical protein